MTIPSSEGLLSPESCLPLTPDEERNTIAELTRAAQANLKEGDVFYVISQRWLTDWEAYVQRESINEDSASLQNSNGVSPYIPNKPGRIDNTELISYETDGDSNGFDLRKDLQEQEHYSFVPVEVWKILVEWYKGGPELPRKVIAEGGNAKSLVIEGYPMCLQLIDARDYSRRTNIRISRQASVSELYTTACNVLNLEPTKVEIWDYCDNDKFSLLKDFDQTVQEAQLQMDQAILLEINDNEPCCSGVDSTENGYVLVPMEASRSPVRTAISPTSANSSAIGFCSHYLKENNFSSSLMDAEDYNDILSKRRRGDGWGLAGLQNLGNTCFMNSALQCLVHTPHLVQFFLRDYTDEINRHNTLGTQGELAISFGDLLRKLWSSGRASYAPREFKSKLTRFAPQFSGYNQHDSQELLAFLLDGLHEDLNRVRNKPYIEVNDANGRRDEEFADECWKYHRTRNDSIIVDVCQGQYKSTLVCPVCSKVSVTFDPFMYLSLPLPSTSSRTMTVTVFNGYGSALPLPYTVTVHGDGSCKDLSQALKLECCLASSQDLLLAEVFMGKIYRYLNSDVPLSSISASEIIVAYTLPMNYKDFVRVEIMHSRIERLFEPNTYVYQNLLGAPLVTCLPMDAITGAEIHAAVANVLAPLLRATSSSSRVKTINDDGDAPNLDGFVPADDSNSCSGDRELSTSDMESGEGDGGWRSFQLALTDERGISRTRIVGDSIISPGPCTKVVLGWSDEDLELYDSSYLENLPGVSNSSFILKRVREESVPLFSCLEAFLKEEPLGPDDMWYCPSCKEHREATKKLDLWRLPDVLVVHLKRFSYSQYMNNKLETFVDFPIYSLDLNKYVKHNGAAASESNIYDLYAVINHYGGLGGGHYTAYAKLLDEDIWYDFDDAHVSPVSEEAIQTSAAYVLFYKRVDSDSGMSGEESSGSLDSASLDSASSDSDLC